MAVLGDITKRRKESIDFLGIWNAQKVDPVLESALAVVSGVVNDDIIRPPQGISNISEWCKKEACWTRIQARTDAIANLLPSEFYDRLVPQDDQAAIVKTAKQTQRIDNGIEAQRKVLAVPATGTPLYLRPGSGLINSNAQPVGPMIQGQPVV